MESKTWTAEAPGRLDRAVKEATGASNNKARRAIATGKVSVDGVRRLDPAFAVAAGARVAVEMAAPNPAKTEPFGLRLVHRDDWLVVVDKPAGLLTTPTHAGEDETALRGAQMLCRGGDSGRVLKVVHRLDRQTSGLLVFARGVPAARAMRGAITARTMRRIYRCVVEGVPERAEGLISSMMLDKGPDGRRASRANTLKVRDRRQPDPGPMPGAGRLAVTRYRVVAQDGERSALEVKLSTGRTHQIRIHLAEMGHPVLGERVYAKAEGAPRQALHAGKLSLPHPESGERLMFESRWPGDLAGVTPRGSDW